MSITDLAAIVGALAWIPPIFIAVRGWLTRPQVRVITQPSPEIGFTTLGPILNLRIALTVTHKDVVITGIRLIMTHESGEKMYFSWRGIVQRMGTINYPQIGAVPFEKESQVLAMKVSIQNIEERFIRFQNLEYLQHKTDLDATVLKKLSHLHRSKTEIDQRFLQSSEMLDVFSFIQQSFGWKPGSYRLRIELESPDVFSVIDDEYSFSLSPLHVQNLSGNLKQMEQYYANEILPAVPDEPKALITWNWVYPEMQLLK
jgi:hypothetical protein